MLAAAMLLLLPLSVSGHAPRLVHVQNLDDEEHDKADSGVDEIATKVMELVAFCFPGDVCHRADRRHVQERHGEGGQHE